MTHTLRRAVRENACLMLAFAGPTGSGKTYSALRVAKGLAGGARFAVIDTEAKRATHYVPPFDFDHLDLRAPFNPDNYLGAIRECERAGYPVIVVDSMSHEWAGEGGLSDWHDEIVHERVERALKRNPNADEQSLVETFNVFGWREPKLAHKRMMQHLLQVRAHLVFCLRAEERVRFVKERDERTNRDVTRIVNAGWQPVCEKNFMFEMSASFLLSPDKPGVPVPIKLQAQHAGFVDLAHQITEATGAAFAAWAIGGAPPAVGAGPADAASSVRRAESPPPSADAGPPPRTDPAPSLPSSTPSGQHAGPDPPTFAPIEAVAMVTRMAGRRGMTKAQLAEALEAAFAPRVTSRQALEMFARQSPSDYRAAFVALHTRFLRWKDEH